jgi:RimJ/RimL family protein N-acetyltransferase
MVSKKAKFMIRKMKIDDLLSEVRQVRSFYSERKHNPDFGYSFAKKKPSEWDLLQNLQWRNKGLENGDMIGSVAEADGKFIGQCSLFCLWPKSEMDHVGELDIAVNEEYRRMGVGAALLKDVLKRNKGRFKVIQTYVFTNNEGSIKLMKKFGFRTVGIVPKMTRRNGRYFDDYVMYLDLS